MVCFIKKTHQYKKVRQSVFLGCGCAADAANARVVGSSPAWRRRLLVPKQPLSGVQLQSSVCKLCS
jgi:hypothetical protein